jgi:hypothetical protein
MATYRWNRKNIARAILSVMCVAGFIFLMIWSPEKDERPFFVFLLFAWIAFMGYTICYYIFENVFVSFQKFMIKTFLIEE